jgi:hypothetical protein
MAVALGDAGCISPAGPEAPSLGAAGASSASGIALGALRAWGEVLECEQAAASGRIKRQVEILIRFMAFFSPFVTDTEETQLAVRTLQFPQTAQFRL